MGLFSKLGHGGVKVQVQAPSSVASNQVIPVTVTVSANKTQSINSVKAELKAQAREQGMGVGIGQAGVGVQDSRTTYQTVAQVESREPFSVGPGETKTVDLQLYVNGTAGGGQSLGGLPNGGGAFGGALRAVANMAGALDHVNYLYRVYASVDVEGAALNPGDHQEIQILPPQETAPIPQPIANSFQAGQPEVPPQMAAERPVDMTNPNNENSNFKELGVYQARKHHQPLVEFAGACDD